MGFLINDRKLKAAAASMHQFCQNVREIFPGDVDDSVVEASTLYLYASLSRDLFGQRFATKLQKKLQGRLKYSTSAEIEGHVARIAKHSEALERAGDGDTPDGTADDAVRAHVTSTIDAMLSDAGFPSNDQEVLKRGYDRFERAIKAMREHLLGIRDQNHFLMRSRTVA